MNPLTAVALSAIMVLGMSLVPALAQDAQVPEQTPPTTTPSVTTTTPATPTPTITTAIAISTDKPTYRGGDTVVVTGTVRDLFPGVPVSLTVIDTNMNIVRIDQITVGADKTFSSEFILAGTFKTQGTYTIKAQYGDVNRSTEATFDFRGEVSVNLPPPDDGNGSTVTATTVSIPGTEDVIGYEITGGRLIGITPNVDSKSLVVSIVATENGSLTLTIPKTILDTVHPETGAEAELIVLVDLAEGEFTETDGETSRVLVIPFEEGTEEIEIVGAFVIPEFGTIAAMILAVAIVSIIAISARSRLSIMPRY